MLEPKMVQVAFGYCIMSKSFLPIMSFERVCVSGCISYRRAHSTYHVRMFVCKCIYIWPSFALITELSLSSPLLLCIYTRKKKSCMYCMCAIAALCRGKWFFSLDFNMNTCICKNVICKRETAKAPFISHNDIADYCLRLN